MDSNTDRMAQSHIVHIFKNKPKQMYPLLGQIWDSNKLMEDYHIKTNSMENLNNVENSNKQLKKINKDNQKINDLHYIQSVKITYCI